MKFFIASIALMVVCSFEQAYAIKVPLLNVPFACLLDNKCEVEPSADKVVCIGNHFDKYLAHARDRCHFESNFKCQRYPKENLEYMEFLHEGECTEEDREKFPVLKSDENVYPPITTAMRTDIIQIDDKCAKENKCEQVKVDGHGMVCGGHNTNKHLVYARSRCIFDAYHQCHSLTPDNSFTFLHEGGCNEDDLKKYPARGTFYG